MKRFIIRIAIFATLAAVLDISVGAAFTRIREMNKGGDVYRLDNIMNSIEDSIIVMGSSRAVHHYVPSIIEKELGLSCYNCGFEGQGIIMHYAVWKEITKRYYPKLVIYDVEAMFDLSTEFDNHRYLSRLKPFYRSNPLIDEIFWSVDERERWKMMAHTYQYNSNCMDLLAGWLHPMHMDIDKGYIPLEGTFRVEPITIWSNLNINIDSLKLHYLERLMSEAKGKTTLAFVISPYFDCKGDGSKYDSIKKLCDKYGCLWLNFSQDERFSHDTERFVHNDHLNSQGSVDFSEDVSKTIGELYE